jgi:type III secretory pathway component EscV
MVKRGDIALAIGVVTILVVLILPLPPILLDLFLAMSIILSVLILMTALFIHTPLEFSAFPTVLLIENGQEVARFSSARTTWRPVGPMVTLPAAARMFRHRSQ